LFLLCSDADTSLLLVMPRFMRGIHGSGGAMDAPDKPGHDVKGKTEASEARK